MKKFKYTVSCFILYDEYVDKEIIIVGVKNSYKDKPMVVYHFLNSDHLSEISIREVGVQAVE